MYKATDLSLSGPISMARVNTDNTNKFRFNLLAIVFTRTTKAQEIAKYINSKEPKSISDIEEIANDYIYR